MKINEIIAEAIDQKDANEVYNALIADGDNLTARYFQQTRNSPKYNNIDSAMFLIDYDLCKDIRWQCDKYNADGYYIKDCFKNNEEIWIYVDELLSFYNFLG